MSKTTGVSVLFHRKLTANVIEAMLDIQGRFFILRVIVNRFEMMLASIPEPNMDEPVIFNRFLLSCTKIHTFPP